MQTKKIVGYAALSLVVLYLLNPAAFANLVSGFSNVGHSHQVTCVMDVNRDLALNPYIGAHTCSRTTESCTYLLDIFGPIGGWNGNLVMSMDGRSVGTGFDAAIGVPTTTLRYPLTLCVSDYVSSGDLFIYGQSGDVVDHKTFSLT